MQKIIYTKKIPRYRSYKSYSKVEKIFLKWNRYRLAGLFLIILGLLLLYIYIDPSFGIFNHSTNKNIINPVPIQTLLEGISKTNKEIDSKNLLNKFIQTSNSSNTAYSKPFLISFPSINVGRIKVTPNVDSTNEKVYSKVLEESTAHFKGTAIPGNPGNVFIYGHSSPVWFHNLYPNSYEGIFTYLFDLKIGDNVNIDIDGKKIVYVIEGIDTIEAKDFSQIQPIQGANTLTLMTCSPPGVGDKRLVIKALQI